MSNNLNEKLASIAQAAVSANKAKRDSRGVVSKGIDIATNKSYTNEDKKVAAAAIREWQNKNWTPKIEAKLKQELKARAPHLKPGTKQYQQTYDSLFNTNLKNLNSAKNEAYRGLGVLRKDGQTQRQLDNEYSINEGVRTDTTGARSAAKVARDTGEAVSGALATGASRTLRYPLQFAADVGENDDGGIFDRGAKALEAHEDNLKKVYPAYSDIQQNGSFSQKLALSATEQIPTLAASLGTAGAAAKGVQLLGAGSKVTAAASYGTAAATMYPQAYGDGNDSTKDELENATPEQLATAVRSKDIYKGHFDKNIKAGMSEDDAYQKARDQTISSIAEESGDSVGLATLALSMLAPGVGSFSANQVAGGAVSKWGQKVFNKLAVKADKGGIAKYAVPAAVGTGIAGLNVAEEALQEGYTDKVAQQAAVDVGVKDKIDTEQFKEAVLMGGALGGLMGGGTYIATRNSKFNQAQDQLKASQQQYAEGAELAAALQEQITAVSPRSSEGQALTEQLNGVRSGLDAMAADAESRGIPRSSLARYAPRIEPTNNDSFDGGVEGSTEIDADEFDAATNSEQATQEQGQPPINEPQMSEQELDAQDAQIAELIAEQQALDEAIEDGSNNKPVEQSLAEAQSWYDSKRGEGKQGLAGVVSRAAATEQDAAFAQQQASIDTKGAINAYIAEQRAQQQQIDAELERDALAAKTEREKKEVEQRSKQREIDRAQEEELLAKRAELAQPYEGESFDATVIGADGAPFNLGRFWDSNLPASAKAKAVAEAFGGQVEQNVAKADWRSMPEGVQKDLHGWFSSQLAEVRQKREGANAQSETSISAPPLAPESQQAATPTASGLTMPVRAEQAPTAPVETDTATQLTDENPTINIPAPTQAKVDVAPTTDEGIYKSKPAAKAAIKKQGLNPKETSIVKVDNGWELVKSTPATRAQARVDSKNAAREEQEADQKSDDTAIPNNDIAIGKDGKAKWFGKQDKAQAFIDKKGISDTHEVVQAGKRFEILPKAQTTGATKQTSTPTDVTSENRSPDTQELNATGKAKITGQEGWRGNLMKSRQLARQLHEAGYMTDSEIDRAFAGEVNDMNNSIDNGLYRQQEAIKKAELEDKNRTRRYRRDGIKDALMISGLSDAEQAMVEKVADTIHAITYTKTVSSPKDNWESSPQEVAQHRATLEELADRDLPDSYTQAQFKDAMDKVMSFILNDIKPAKAEARYTGEDVKNANNRINEAGDNVSRIIQEGESRKGELKDALSAQNTAITKGAKVAKSTPAKNITDEQFAELTSSRTTPSTPTGEQSAPAKRAAAKKAAKENKVFGVAQKPNKPKQEGLTVEPGGPEWRNSMIDITSVIRTLVKKGYLEKSEYDNSSRTKSVLTELAIKGINAERAANNLEPMYTAKKAQNDVSAQDAKPKRKTAAELRASLLDKNKVVTKEAAAEYRATLKSSLGSLNSGFDPKASFAAMGLAAAYIEGGIRNFTDFATLLIDDAGVKVKSYLLPAWEAARNFDELDTTGMDSAEDSRKQFNELVESGFFDDVQAETEQESEPTDPSLPSDEKAVLEIFDMSLSDVFNIVFKEYERLNRKAKRTRDQDDQAAANKAKRKARQDIMDVEQAVIDYAERKMTLGRFLDSKAGEYQELIDAVYKDRDRQAGFSGNKPADTKPTSEPTKTEQSKYPQTVGSGPQMKTFVGENQAGLPLYENESGVRAIEEYGIFNNETVSITPTGIEQQPREDRYLTKEELAAKKDADNDTTRSETDQGGAAEAGEPAGLYPQSRNAQDDTGNMGARQSEDDGAAQEGGSDGRSSSSVPRKNVADKGSVPSGKNATDGRKGASGEGSPNARAGTVKSPAATASQATDLLIDNPLEIVGGTPVQRFNKNRAALELLEKLEVEARQATPDEQKVLAAYIGWGSFGQELFQGSWEYPKYKDEGIWKERGQWLRDMLGESAWKSAQRSITNAHYTDPPTVMAMWDMLTRMGFEGGRVLEPSMGTGNFFSMMPASVKARSQLTGIELDETTGKIAKQLFPQSNVQIMGYQDSKTPDSFYDVVIGNWPFENTAVADRRYNKLNPMLHDYFFLKTMDQVRPGGIVIGITSAGSMDKKNTTIRRELAKQAELVSAIRLPSGAFKDYAGTSVVTDIVILRKRPERLDIVPEDATWTEIGTYDKTPSGNSVEVNQYYLDNPQNIIGTLDYGHGTTAFGPGMIVRRPDNMSERLQQAVELVPENAIQENTTTDHLTYYANKGGERHGSIFEQDGELMLVRGDQAVLVEKVARYKVKSKKTTDERETQLRSAIDMRRKHSELVDAERANEDAEPKRKALKAAYKSFVKAHGPLRDSYALKYMDKVNDPFFYELAALEDDNGNPATIMDKSTTRSMKTLDNPSIREAYVLARNQSVAPAVKDIAKLAGTSEAAVKKELKDSGAVMEAPNGDIVPSDIYLSGNVRQKLREAQAALDNGNSAMQRNVDALNEVVPEDVPYFNIETKLGATWVPIETYQDYIAHMLGLDSTKGIEVTFTGGRWKVRLPKGTNSISAARTNYGTVHYKFSDLAQAAIRNQTVKITKTDPNGEKYYDAEASNEANARIGKIREDFATWLWSDPERRIDLEREYNESRNAWATPKYDGSFLTFEGMALTLGKGEFNLREHQANAIWRALVNRRSLNAHEVGTGKTFTMGGIAIESRRYGIAKKPVILAHNANSAAVAAEIRMMYPSSRVLYVDNLDTKNRELRLRQIANDDWDAIVMPHSLIDRLALTEDTLMRMAADDIAALEAEFYAAAAEDGVDVSKVDLDDDKSVGGVRSRTAKEMAKTRKRVIEGIKKQAQQASKANAVTFEDLGIDMILVDEVHEFKKPPIVTSMSMKGLSTDVSQKSIQLQFLTRYVRQMNNGGNVHTFTGTPITNTITEIYHQMRYVMDSEMDKVGVSEWDGWFGSFATEIQDVELTSAGDYEMTTRLAGFINVPELRQMVGQYMDTVFAEDMPEMQPRKTDSGKTMADDSLTEKEKAHLLNGRTEGAKDRPYKKVINDTADMTPLQEAAFAKVQSLANEWRNADGKTKREWKNSNDPRAPFAYTNIAEKASIDVRLLDPSLVGKEGQTNDDPNSKTSRAIKNIMEVYHSDKDANQVVFIENGYNTTATRSTGTRDDNNNMIYEKVDVFSPVKDMVERLVQSGIPRDQIAVVTGSTKKEERHRIAQAVNNSEIRVVIGSTQTLGVGVNMQRNLRAMHHMDAPYMPGELEQRNGRGQRQGNQWNTVLEYRYMTDRLDGKRWQILAVKQRFIAAFMKSRGDTRTIEGDAAEEDQSDILESFSEAAGDPRVLQRVKLQGKQDSLKNKERIYTRGIADMKREIRSQKDNAAKNKASLANLDPKIVENTLQAQRDGFKAVVNGKSFDKRADAVEAVNKFVESNIRMSDTKPVDIGTYAGVPLKAVWDNFDTEAKVILELGGHKFAGKGIAGLEAVMRNFPKFVDNMQAAIDKANNTIESLEKAVQQPFGQAEDLERNIKQLEDLQKDLEMNPVPPPAWLRQGAPMDSEVHYNKSPFIVTGHRYDKNGWFVIAEDSKGQVAIPYLEAKDATGMQLYDEKDFVAPEVIENKKKKSEDSKDNDSDEIDVSTDAPKFSKTNPAKGNTGTTAKQVVSTLQKRFGKEAVAALIKSGKLRVRTLNDFVNSDGRLLIPDDAEGFYHDGKVVLIADNLTDDTAVATLLHELGGHAGIQNMLAPQTYMSLMNNFEKLVESGNKYAIAAKERAEATTYSDSEARDEYIPYLITEYAQATERGGPLAVIKRFVNRVMAGVRAWVRNHTGVQLKMTPNDMVQLAERMVKRLAEQSASDMTIAGIENMTAGRAQFSQVDASQTDTPAFKKWFGDSKVVDGNGEPLVVYHGSPDVRGIFNDGGFQPSMTRGNVYFAAKDYDTANSYADDRRAFDYRNAEAQTIPLYVSIKNPMVVDGKGRKWRDTEKYIQEAKDAGHDGIIIKNSLDYYNSLERSGKPTTVYAWFNPTQAKSAVKGNLKSRIDGIDIEGATGNNGTFDPTNPDIRFSRRYSNLGTDTSPTTAKEKAIDAAKQSAATALSSKFNLSLLLRRHLATPLHVGMLNPSFKTFFENVQARIAYENNEAGRIQEYMPEIWDTKLMVGKRKKAIDKVSRALFDGTMADQVWTDSELETRFNLDDNQIDMYRRARAAIDSSVLNMTVDTLSSLAKGTKLVNIHTINRLKLAGLTPTGHNLMIQQHMTDELQRLSQSGSITPAAESRLQNQLDSVFDVMDSVAVKYDDLVEKGYAPLMRFGHYAVEVRDKSTNDLDLFELYETKGQQRKAIKELKEKYNENDFEVGTGTLNPDAFKQFTGKGLSPETVQLFAAELGLDTDGAHQAYLKVAISNQSALKRLIHRKKVPGYSEDLPRVLSSFVMSNARYSGRALYNGEIENAIQKIEDGNLQGEAQNVFANMENPQEEFAGVRGLLFHYYMGFSTAFMALNFTQPFTQTIPKLTAYVGAARAHRDMTQALGIITKYTGKATFEFGKKVTGNATPSWKGFEDHLPAWVRTEDYLRMTREGHLDPQNIWMIRGLERGKAGVISGLWGNLSRAAGWAAEVSETINRRGTMIAAFKAAQTMGDARLRAEGFNSRYDFAVSIIQQTQGVYNKGNRSGLARGTGKLGQFGPLVMVFKQFSINYAEQMIRHGRDKEVKSIAVAMAWQFMLAGMLGLPFTDDLRDIVEGLLYRLFGRATNLTAFLQDELGKDNADALMYGLLSEKTRFDMYGRSNMGNFIPGTDFARPQEGDWAEVIGASSGFFENFFTAGDMITKGQYKDAAVIAAPRYIRDAAAGIEIWNNGAYRNQKGDKVMDMDRTDAVIKGALQFNPASNAQQGRERSEKYHMKNMVLDKQNQFALQLTEALYQENYDRVDELYNDMDAWNERNPEHFNVDIDKIEDSAERRLNKKDFTSEDRQKLPEQLDDYFTERE